MPAFRRHWLWVAMATLSFVALSSIFLLLHSKKAPDANAFQVGYQPTMLYLPIFVAQEKGFFARHGVHVELVRFESANEMAQALATGRIDATGMSSISVLGNLEKTSPGTFWIYLVEAFTPDKSPDALVVRSDSDIWALSDLKGKKLGIPPGTTLRDYADRFLQSAIGVNHRVTFVQMQTQIQVQALQSGGIDALFSLEPIPTLAKLDTGARTLERGLLAKHIHNPFYGGAGIIAANAVMARAGTVSEYRAAVRDALRFIRENEGEARNVLAKYGNVSKEVAREMPLIEWLEPNDVSIADWNGTVQALVGFGQFPGSVDLSARFLGN